MKQVSASNPDIVEPFLEELFEYINSNIPIIASDLPELRRIILEYEIGYLFDPNQPQSIAAAIHYVLSNKNRYLTMKANVINSAKEFNWDNESKKFLDCYNSF